MSSNARSGSRETSCISDANAAAGRPAASLHSAMIGTCVAMKSESGALSSRRPTR